MKKLLTALVMLAVGLVAVAQTDPVKWSASITRHNDSLYRVTVDATIARSWPDAGVGAS